MGITAWLAAIAAGAAATPPAADTAILLAAPELVAADIVLLGLEHGGRMSVPVRVQGSSPYPFVVDTGAERTIVSAELARALALPAGPRLRIISMSGPSSADSVHVGRLDLGEQRIGGLVAPALAGRHIGAAGMIGLDTLQDRRVHLDFTRGTMAIEPSAAREAPVEPGTIVVRGRSRYGQLILVDAAFAGERVVVILDTGAEVSVGNRALERRLRVRGSSPILLTSVVGGTVSATLRQVGDMRLGGLTLTNLPVAFVDAPPFARLGLGETPAMLLGMDAMRAFDRVTIDFARRRVRFDAPRRGVR